MGIDEVIKNNYPICFYAQQAQKNNTSAVQKSNASASISTGFTQQMENYTDLQAGTEKNDMAGKNDIMEKAEGSLDEQAKEPLKEEEQESTSDTEIITRPDGSRVLLITMHVGGMKAVTSIALSESAPLMGETGKDYSQNEYQQSDYSQGDTIR